MIQNDKEIGPKFWLEQCRVERDDARTRVGQLETDRDELLEQCNVLKMELQNLQRKDELLCNQNAALIIEINNLKAQLRLT